jgi:hypothetical protein
MRVLCRVSALEVFFYGFEIGVEGHGVRQGKKGLRRRSADRIAVSKDANQGRGEMPFCGQGKPCPYI